MKMIRKKDIKTMIRASRTRPNLIIIARIEKHNPTGEQASLPPLSNADSIREAGIYSWKIFAGKMNNAVRFKRPKWGIARIYEIFARGGEKKKKEKRRKRDLTLLQTGETENKFWHAWIATVWNCAWPPTSPLFMQTGVFTRSFY